MTNPMRISGHGTEYVRRFGPCHDLPGGKMCFSCRDAFYAAQRAERLKADPSIREHGKPGTYKNYKCRCPDCCEARYREDRARRTGTPRGANGRRGKPMLRIEPFTRKWMQE